MLALYITLGVIGGLLLIGVLAVIGFYNSLVRQRNQVEEGFSTMDVYMKKRYDLVPNLVNTVKGYAKHEKETLENVIKARNMAMKSKTSVERGKNENMLSDSLKSLFALSENYPALQANASFMDLQKQLQAIEVDISNARKYYNATVKTYNNRIDVFPSNIIAKMFKFERKPMFEIEVTERKNVSVNF